MLNEIDPDSVTWKNPVEKIKMRRTQIALLGYVDARHNEYK